MRRMTTGAFNLRFLPRPLYAPRIDDLFLLTYAKHLFTYEVYASLRFGFGKGT